MARCTHRCVDRPTTPIHLDRRGLTPAPGGPVFFVNEREVQDLGVYTSISTLKPRSATLPSGSSFSIPKRAAAPAPMQIAEPSSLLAASRRAAILMALPCAV